MKLVFPLAIVLLLIPVMDTSAQQNMRDVVHLKNGSVIKGMIVEQVPGESIKIQTADGSVFFYRMEEIERITKEQYEVNVRRKKSVFGAFIYSSILPGLGQHYIGDNKKGYIMNGLTLVSLPFMFNDEIIFCH